jgi:hypothetical protein
VPDCAALHTFDYRKVRAVEGLRYEHPRPNKQPQYHANNSFVRYLDTAAENISTALRCSRVASICEASGV